MNQALTQEARNEAAAERELARIYRTQDRRNARRKPATHPLMTAAEVCQMFGFRRSTLTRRVETGKLPPPCNKPVVAPADPAMREAWQRDHRRWNRKLMMGLSWGILPPIIHSFTCPAHWVQFLRDHKEFL